ncbi:MAG: polyhydroxyalkanoate synthesis repressor PhaR [Myxococcota bacterium]|jgi:polyhydroxyalkanoate synthesis repressor PhaR
MADDKAPRVIKRYANRKLYDMSESCYITHDEIAALVRAGEEIRIIDNSTKEDLTTATLTQILFDNERKTRKTLPIDTLRNIFQTGGEFITNLRDEAEKKLPKVFRPRGDKESEEEGVEEPVEEPTLADGTKGTPAETLREAYDTLQRNLEDRWSDVVGYMGQFDVNHKRISELERRVEVLEEQLDSKRGVDEKA